MTGVARFEGEQRAITWERKVREELDVEEVVKHIHLKV
jgi:hypothetical protein